MWLYDPWYKTNYDIFVAVTKIIISNYVAAAYPPPTTTTIDTLKETEKSSQLGFAYTTPCLVTSMYRINWVSKNQIMCLEDGRFLTLKRLSLALTLKKKHKNQGCK